MYDHLGLKVRDLAASARFYEAVLGPLGCELCSTGDGYAGLGPRGEPALWLYGPDERPTGGVHVAFRAANREAVDRFHARGLAAGGRDHGAPGIRADYAPTHYAAFLLDPDGNNVEAVCMSP